MQWYHGLWEGPRCLPTPRRPNEVVLLRRRCGFTLRTADHQYNADTCINRHANGLIEQNTTYKGADRPNIMKRFFADCSLVLGDINELESSFDGGIKTFVQHLIVSLFNKKFAKKLSQIGGITLDKGSFADYFRVRLWKRCIRLVDALVHGSRTGISSFLHRQ